MHGDMDSPGDMVGEIHGVNEGVAAIKWCYVGAEAERWPAIVPQGRSKTQDCARGKWRTGSHADVGGFRFSDSEMLLTSMFYRAEQNIGVRQNRDGHRQEKYRVAEEQIYRKSGKWVVWMNKICLNGTERAD